MHNEIQSWKLLKYVLKIVYKVIGSLLIFLNPKYKAYLNVQFFVFFKHPN